MLDQRTGAGGGIERQLVRNNLEELVILECGQLQQRIVLMGDGLETAGVENQGPADAGQNDLLDDVGQVDVRIVSRLPAPQFGRVAITVDDTPEEARPGGEQAGYRPLYEDSAPV